MTGSKKPGAKHGGRTTDVQFDDCERFVSIAPVCFFQFVNFAPNKFLRLPWSGVGQSE